MERARSVLAEDRILRLTPHEVNQLGTSAGLRARGRSQPRAGRLVPDDVIGLIRYLRAHAA
jgi:hypothetical protein